MNRIKILFFTLFFSLTPNYICCADDSVRGQHFEIFYYGLNKGYAEQALKNSENSYNIISEALGHSLEKNISIILTSSDKHFQELTRDAIPEWSAAVTLNNNSIIVSPLAGQKRNLSLILAHEIVHIVINDAVREKFVPRWFHEGCAQNLSGEWRVRDRLYMVWKVTRGKLLTFEDIQDVFSSERVDAALAYDQSMLAIRQFIYKNGQDALPTVIGSMKKGNDFATAFWEASGLWPSEFEKDYLDIIRRKYGKRSLYSIIPGTWTLILLIAAIVYVVKRRRNKRLMRQWEIVEAAEKIIRFEDYSGSP